MKIYFVAIMDRGCMYTGVDDPVSECMGDEEAIIKQIVRGAATQGLTNGHCNT